MVDLALRGLHKAFGASHILNGVDLDIADGDFVVILGPSGCGKSTLLRIIAGLETIDSGDLLSQGTSIVGQSPMERGVAMVFQSYALYPHLNVFENIAFGLRVQKLPEAEIIAAVEGAARMLGIEDLLERKPRALSGGQRQRVAIGRAIVRRPRFFLLDEPLSNLDAGLRVHMRHEFARLHRDLKTTTIYVTHDQVEAMTLGTRVVVLNAGKVAQAASPIEVYHHPANLFVADFLGSPRINILGGVIEALTPQAAYVRLGNGQTVNIALDPQGAHPRAQKGDKVHVGVRPESFRSEPSKTASRAKAPSRNRLELKIEIVEALGPSISLYGRVDGMDSPLTAVMASLSGAAPGQTHTLSFAPDDAYLFVADGTAFARPRKTS